MKGAAVVVIVSTLLGGVGCDQLFGIQHVDTNDAAIDAPAPCEDPTPFGTNCRTLTLPLTSDTYLSAATPDTVFGGRDAIRISATEPGLFKFLASSIEADERIAAMTLTLDPLFSKSAMACSTTGTTCMQCPTPAIGRWYLHHVTANWNEAEATWNAAGTTPWTAPGAAAIPQDRSDVLVSGPPVTSGNLVMSVPSDTLRTHSPNCFRRDDGIALLVTVDGVSYFEALQPNQCTVPGLLPALSVTVCR